MFDDTPKFKNYQVIGKLGEGAQGKVYKVKWQNRKRDVFGALKFLNSSEVRKILKEVSTWARVSQHPNILTFITADEDNERFFIISELATEGDLEKWIEEKGGKEEFFDEAIEIMFGVLRGLEHLHQNDIVHRDIKPANIFLKDKTPLLADFGLARGLDLKQSSVLGGTLAYMSPELIGVYLSLKVGSKLNYERTESDDLWAVAVTFQQMLTGEMPFESIDAIRKCQPNPLSIKVSTKIEDFLKTAFAKNSSERFQTAEKMSDALIEAVRILEKETIIDEDFDTTEEYESDSAEDWRKIKAEKQRQREEEQTKLESERRKREKAEQARLEKEKLQRETEAKRIQREREENLRKQKEAEEAIRQKQEEEKRIQKSKKQRNFALGSGGIIGVILVLIWMSQNPSVSVSNSNFANTAANTASSSSGEIFKNSIGMEFVKIPSGSFMMGSENGESNEKPVHKVTISTDFYMGKYEVTQSQWQSVMGNNPSNFIGDNLPVGNVSWDDAQEFIKKLNAKGEGTYRLPTEAEWEYAARSGTTGDYAGNLDAMAWYNKNSGNETHEVGTKQANAWGLYDMHGNVWEWVQDYESYQSGSVTDPTGASSGSGRVLRGGGWNGGAVHVRSVNRDAYSPSTRLIFLGFRLVRY